MSVISGNIRKILATVALPLLSMLHIQPLFGGELIFKVEEPRAGSVMTGVSNIRGWAVSSSGIDRIEMYIDGEYKTDIPFGGSRKDVGDSYPEFPDSDNSGYSMANNYNLKSAGPHVMTVKAFDNDGSMQQLKLPYSVTRFEDSFISHPADINILQVTDILLNDGRSLTLEGVDVQGEKQDIQLEWQTQKQNFSMTGIRPSTDGDDTSLDGLYSLSRLTLWYRADQDFPNGLILDTEAGERTVEGVTFDITASGSLEVRGPTIHTSLKLTLTANEMIETIADSGTSTLIADYGFAIDYSESTGEILTAVLLQRGTRLIWMEDSGEDPEFSSGTIVVQWKKIAEPATQETTAQQFDQLISSEAGSIPSPSLTSAILQSFINVLRGADK